MDITPQRSNLEAPTHRSGRWRTTQWPFSAASIKGTFHAVNQDSFHCKAGHFWGVADGVGGGAHGEIASQMLMARMAALSAPSPDIIHAALLEADQQIGDWIQAQGKGSGAAVMACLWAKDPQAWQVALVGDCKVMHMQRQAGRWHRLWASPEQTYDYAGLQPPEGVSANSPANMIGCGLAMPALMHTLRIRDRERLVVCSDGFSSQCERGALAQRVADAASPLEPGLAQAWCDAARDAGSQDDITVLIIERHDQFTPLARISLAVATALVAGVAALAWSWA